MRKAKAAGISIGIIFIILVIMGGLLYYSYTQINVELDTVSFHSIDLVNITFSTLVNLGLQAITGDWLGAAIDLVDGVKKTFLNALVFFYKMYHLSFYQ